ncbi:MAG: ABC transporter permease subunit [Acidimicrobiales bacterium]
MTLAFNLLVFLVVNNEEGLTEGSRGIRAFKALRDNPARAASLGVDIRTYTLLAFSIGAGQAGVAGALYARLIEYIEPRAFYIGQSFDFFLATVVGGLGSLVGPFIGSRSSPSSPTACASPATTTGSGSACS